MDNQNQIEVITKRITSVMRLKNGRPKVVTDDIKTRILELNSRGLSLRAIARLAKVSRSSVGRTIKRNV